MATYFDDCSALTEFSEVGINSATDYSISTGFIVKASNNLEVLKHDDASADADSDDAEILFKVNIGAMSTTYYVGVVRGNGTTSGAYTGYMVALRSAAIRLYSRASGAWTEIDSDTASHSADTDYWVRLRANGSTISAASSAGSGDPPSSFVNQVTNTTHTGTGYCGLQGPPVTTEIRWKALGVGTNGDTAPSSGAPPAATVTLSNLEAVSITTTGATLRCDFDFA